MKLNLEQKSPYHGKIENLVDDTAKIRKPSPGHEVDVTADKVRQGVNFPAENQKQSLEKGYEHQQFENRVDYSYFFFWRLNCFKHLSLCGCFSISVG